MPSDAYYLDVAKAVRLQSKDRSRRVGAVVVGPDGEIRSTGYNGFPRKVNDDVNRRHGRPAKYMWTEHAERNAIYQAARVGTSLKGCKMYVWLEGSESVVCAGCARAIIQAGLTRVVLRASGGPEGSGPGWPIEDLAASTEMLAEAGVAVVYQ